MGNLIEPLNNLKNRVANQFNEDYTLGALRLMIIAWSIFVIVLALIIDNKVMLAGVLAYEVLP